MRKTNIAFSGFMAAILFSAGAANAATQIASKQYVDNRETSLTMLLPLRPKRNKPLIPPNQLQAAHKPR